MSIEFRERINGMRKNVANWMKKNLPFIPIGILMTAFAVLVFFVVIFLQGTILKICWNLAMPAMLGFNEITWFQAFMISFTISCLKEDFTNNISVFYSQEKKDCIKEGKDESIVKILAAVRTALIWLITVVVSMLAVRYTWNNILPSLLGMDLIKISMWQAFGFGTIVNLVLKIPTHSSKKEKNEKKDEKTEESNSEKKDEVVQVDGTLEPENTTKEDKQCSVRTLSLAELPMHTKR